MIGFTLALVLAAHAPAAPAEGVAWGVATSMDKLRPGDPVPRARAIDLVAARGECEAAQVAVRPGGPIALSAEAAPLAGARALPVALYRVDTLPLARPSGLDGAAGGWPDPLVPARDAFFDEPRRAFPARVPAGALQAVWVELCVPADAAPGRYHGVVRIRDGARTIARVPLELRVWPFALPATSSVPVTFGIATRLGTRALGAPDDPDVAHALAAAALRHRVSPHGLSFDPPSGRCTAAECRLDWSAYDAEVGPVLDGTLVPGVRGLFADLRVPASVWSGHDADAVAYLRAWREHFEARGWADRLWLYTLDEPRPEQLPELARRARLAREAGVRVFATTRPAPQLAGLVDAFVPNVTHLDGADGARAFTSSKPGRDGAGQAPFWYASCLSHGCGELPAKGAEREAWKAAFRGWPGYEIDRPAAAARAIAWLGWRQRVAGELYYDMIHAWRGDPWSDPRAFAGNGDGTLLYPGLPERLGGTRPFPVESIRLKVIRDGLEDLEMLRLAEARGLGRLAARLAERVAPSVRGFSRDGRSWLLARRELGEALAGARASR
jgi:hypothetical protein